MENKSFACWLKQQNIQENGSKNSANGTTLGSEKLIENARRELNRMLELPENHEPDRGDLDEPTVEWRSGKPDYTLANLAYLKGKSMSHEKDSLEMIVENAVKKVCKKIGMFLPEV